MKAKRKRKHLERKREKTVEKKEREESREENSEDEVQEQPSTARKPRNIRFLECLQKTCARVAGCMRRKTSSQEKSSELPGPSNIHPMDSTGTEKKCIKVDEKEIDWVTDSFVEQVILQDYQQIHDQIHSLEVLYTQYYGGLNGDIHNGGEELENIVKKDGGGELEETDKAKKRRKIEFLACLRRPWDRIADLKWRGTYIIKEEPSSEIPGPIYISMVDNNGNLSSKREKREDDEGENVMTEVIEKMLDPSSATVPLSLASFTFHRTLGEGAFGQVFLATDVIRKESVAIKVVKKRIFTEHGCSFIERHVLQLSHQSPYLIHGLAAFHTLNNVYYVMELATRGDLDKFIIKNYPFDTATVKFITAEVVCGTQFLHGKGILHRDLKPENILLTREGHIKITDFGLAVKGVFKRTKNECDGTPGYAPPEMLKGQAYGRGVDLFAIGVILYKLSTFKNPFPGKYFFDIENNILHHNPLFPKSLAPDTVNIIEGLLCKDQFQRLGVKGNIRKHPFFSDINWKDVEGRRMAPPVIMMSGSVDLDVGKTLDYAEPSNRIGSKDQKIFHQFSFVCPEWSKQYHPDIIQTKNWMTKLFRK